MNLVKSKQRVADHGEVFTPAWGCKPKPAEFVHATFSLSL